MGTLILGFIALFGILLASQVASIDTLLNNLILSIGVLIAFYYGATGVTCAWAYRKVAFQSTRFFFTGVLLPFVGGVVLLLVMADVIKTGGWSGSYADIIALLMGIPLVILARVTTKGDFFKTRPISYTEIGE